MTKITLQIKRKELDLIKAGTKKTDWRAPSLYNKKRLLKKNEAGKFETSEVTEIEYINGMKPDAERLTVQVLSVRPVKFSRDVDISEDNFHALEGQCSIQIKLGKILNSK